MQWTFYDAKIRIVYSDRNKDLKIQLKAWQK